MKRLLDTNVCIDVLRGRRKVVERLSACSPEDCVVSVITEFELFQGADRAPADRRDEERIKVARFLKALRGIPFDSECARIAARINADLMNRGQTLSITDVFIGATALRHGWPVVTNNTKDFRRIAGLVLEDWR